MNHASVHVTAVAETVAYHCPHTGDAASYRLTSNLDPLTVYLWGTPAELQRFAHALLARVAEQVPA